MDEDGFLEDDEEEVPLTEEEISTWAAGLRPEGAPGVMTQRMREFLGDEGYEKATKQNDAVAALYIQRQTLINQFLSVATLYGGLLGLVAFVASVTLLIKFIF